MNKRLLIDTATDTGLVALLEGPTIKALHKIVARSDISTQLAPVVQRLLDQADWPIATLDEICVGMGPGSYTGVRAGVALGQALAYASKAKFRGVPTTCLFVAPNNGHYIVLLDARAGGVYCMQGQKLSAGHYHMDAPPQRLSLEAAHHVIVTQALTVISPHATTLKERWQVLNAEPISILEVGIDAAWVASGSNLPSVDSILYADDKWQPAMHAHASISIESLPCTAHRKARP